ncbi:response regulator [Desulfonema magnum]|uniref:Two component system response regulator n=1 Tax=Desulfonema magnum TaxID=45655 RepID=A0A975BGN8_9BACT|nr:response regulator [Desulfonema magnum]QTA84963.1 Two component system response regulator [Desulfonema magnum]
MKKIMIVEDEVLIALEMSFHLKDMGYDILQPVATGEDAVKKAESERPDIILMDIRLAGKTDGVEAAKAIHLIRKIPIIFMTGYSDDGLIKEIEKLAPLAVFNKPVDMQRVKSVIDSYFCKA